MTQESCNSSGMSETPSAPRLNDLDRRIVAALQADPRASWAQLGAAVGVSETTVLRRVQRLRASGSLEVVGAADPLRCGFGQPVLLTLRTVPGEALTLARYLAERADVRFVALLTGGSDLLCELIVPDRSHLSRVLMIDLPKTGAVLSTTTEFVLKTFKTSDQWSRALLDEDARSLQARSGPAETHQVESGTNLDDMDTRLLAALSRDGRRTYADLSQELGLSETAIARRVTALTTSNRLYFVAMVDPAALGFEFEAVFHLRVELSALESIASTLAEMTQVRYVSATTGNSDLFCEAIFKDTVELYEFVTASLGAVDGIREVAVDIVLDTVKRAFRYPLFATQKVLVKAPKRRAATTP
jgi:DNA-binding Lrp family transcriptional regulator